MGDTTYHHIFGSNENTAENARQQEQVAAAPQQLAPAALEQLFLRADKATDILRSAIKTNLDSPGTSIPKIVSSPLPHELFR